MNVLMGRYKTFPKESKMLLRGEYGRLPGKVNEEVIKMAIGDEAVIECRPADNIANEMETLRESVAEFAKSEEDVLSCALFPQVAPGFIKKRDSAEAKTEEKTSSDDKIKEINVIW